MKQETDADVYRGVLRVYEDSSTGRKSARLLRRGSPSAVRRLLDKDGWTSDEVEACVRIVGKRLAKPGRRQNA